MSHPESHSPGSFSWIELATSDQSAAKTFYTSLFGWTYEDSPMGPSDVYTMFQFDGRYVGAAYTMREEEKAAGIPPHWNLYITVAGADESAKKAGELGGNVLVPPFDVATYGRMAVIADPAGAAFCIWEAKDHAGSGVINEPGAFCWADLATPDQEGATKFYTELFGWSVTPGEGGYLHLKNGEAFIGGIPPADNATPGVPPHWMSYIQVADIKGSSAKAGDLGGKICFGPMPIGDTGSMAVLSDPQGAVLALFELARHG
jgi:predicted enzyme related to lactoylglutathione lyase